MLAGVADARFPVERWRLSRTNNAIERLNWETGRRARIVGAFRDGKSAIMLVAARLKYVADSERGPRGHLDALLLDEWSCRRAWGAYPKCARLLTALTCLY